MDIDLCDGLHENGFGNPNEVSHDTLMVRMKRVSNSLEEIEDALPEKISQKRICKSKKGKRNRQSAKIKNGISTAANKSVSNEDFVNARRRDSREEALKTWELGKLPGTSANCDDEVIVEKLMDLESRD